MTINDDDSFEIDVMSILRQPVYHQLPATYKGGAAALEVAAMFQAISQDPTVDGPGRAVTLLMLDTISKEMEALKAGATTGQSSLDAMVVAVKALTNLAASRYTDRIERLRSIRMVLDWSKQLVTRRELGLIGAITAATVMHFGTVGTEAR